MSFSLSIVNIAVISTERTMCYYSNCFDFVRQGAEFRHIINRFQRSEVGHFRYFFSPFTRGFVALIDQLVNGRKLKIITAS